MWEGEPTVATGERELARTAEELGPATSSGRVSGVLV